MISRLPAFVGTRLRDARLARELTAVSLAERVGVGAASISKYEKGGVTPRPPLLTAMAEVLSVPESYFFKAPNDPDPAPFWYRSLAAATKRARDSAEARQEWAREIVSYVSAMVPLKQANIPDLSRNLGPRALSLEDAEEAAAELRRAWGLGDGPIGNVTDLIESMGVVCARFALNADTLDAFSRWTRECPMVVTNSDRCTAVRMRFDYGHELGHLVLHRNVPASESQRPEIHKLMELQAHRFGSAFLVPAKSFIGEIYSISLDALLLLKKRWKVSAAMMIRRAKDLGIISDYQYSRAFRSLSAANFRRSEPLDDEMAVEQPTRLASSFLLMLSEGRLTKEDMLQQLRLPKRDVEVIASLPPGFFDQEEPAVASNVIAFPRRQ